MKKINTRKLWLSIDDTDLENLYSSRTLKTTEIAHILNRSQCAVQQRVKKLGLKNKYFKKELEYANKKWNILEENQLIKLYGCNKLTMKEIAYVHKRSINSIKYRLRKLMLNDKKRNVIKEKSYQRWTNSEETELMDQYVNKQIDIFDIGTNLKRTLPAIKIRLKKLLKKQILPDNQIVN